MRQGFLNDFFSCNIDSNKAKDSLCHFKLKQIFLDSMISPSVGMADPMPLSFEMIANGSTGLSFATVSLTVEPKGFK
jgi:hypothetical protein